MPETLPRGVYYQVTTTKSGKTPDMKDLEKALSTNSTVIPALFADLDAAEIAKQIFEQNGHQCQIRKARIMKA